MMKTGNWTVPDLVKYLVSVRDSLSKDELERLRETRAFSIEGQATAEKRGVHRPKDLYIPQEELRALGLPILDWGQGKWKPSSDEGLF
jgi:hypothetical protein